MQTCHRCHGNQRGRAGSVSTSPCQSREERGPVLGYYDYDNSSVRYEEVTLQGEALCVRRWLRFPWCGARHYMALCQRGVEGYTGVGRGLKAFVHPGKDQTSHRQWVGDSDSGGGRPCHYLALGHGCRVDMGLSLHITSNESATTEGGMDNNKKPNHLPFNMAIYKSQ